MLGFLLIGSAGLLLLVLALVLDDLLDGLFETGGLLSGPALGAFLAAFGFGGALVLQRPGTTIPVATGGGLVAGMLVGGVAGLMVRQIMRMGTDMTPSQATLVGATGTVVTPITPERTGEALLRVVGSPVKVTARAEVALPVGAQVTVTTVISPTSVIVTPAATPVPPAV